MPQYDESHRAMNTDTPRTQEAAREDVCIGMVAGFPSAAQYYAAAQQAVDRDNDIERCESPKRSDTPMTDANCWSQDADIYRGEIINSNFARRLERELNEANAITEKQAEMLTCQAERNAQLAAYLEAANAKVEGYQSIEEKLHGLQKWKDEQMAVESSWDCQAVGKMLGMTMGVEIRREIAPKIAELNLSEFVSDLLLLCLLPAILVLVWCGNRGSDTAEAWIEALNDWTLSFAEI
jgi:hypothetical protein